MKSCIRVLGLTVVVLGPSTAFAEWGTLDQARVCEKEYAASQSWGNLHVWPYQIVVKLKAGSISAACKAEIQRRAESCSTDGNMIGIFRELKDKNDGMTMKDMCNYRAFGEISDQFLTEVNQKKAAEEQAKAEAAEKEQAEKDRQEKLATTELPKAEMKDPALEKAVAQAYAKDYGNKVLKVILFGWSDDLEKDALGRVTGRDMSATVVNKHADGTCELHYELWLQHGSGKSFSGPLSPRGAGSMQTTEISCSKVEGSPEPAKKKGK